VDWLSNKNIAVGKPPGSTSEITQAIDRGKLLKAWKTKLKHTAVNTVIDEAQMTRLKKVITLHEERFLKPDDTAMSNDKRKMMCEGLLRCQAAAQYVYRKSTIMESFRLTGVYPYSFEQIFRSFRIMKLKKR
jgi:2-oxoglutarate dehydrogenase complex dehydrogenase (E1) component-like enzyme